MPWWVHSKQRTVGSNISCHSLEGLPHQSGAATEDTVHSPVWHCCGIFWTNSFTILCEGLLFEKHRLWPLEVMETVDRKPENRLDSSIFLKISNVALWVFCFFSSPRGRNTFWKFMPYYKVCWESSPTKQTEISINLQSHIHGCAVSKDLERQCSSIILLR